MNSRGEKRIFALSENQQGIYFDCQVEEVPHYNLSAAISIKEAIDVDLFEAAIKILVDRHSILRTCFRVKDNEPQQVIFPEVEFNLDVQDISNLEAKEQEEAIKRVYSENVLTEFDLAQPPLFRAKLVKKGETEYLFFLCMHHIISDGWSLELFRKKLLTTYLTLQEGEEIKEETVEKEFVDFVVAENKKIKAGEYQEQQDYWLQKMEDAESLNLLTDHPVTSADQGYGKEYQFVMEDKLHQELQEISREQGTTLFMFLFAAFKVLLHKYTGDTDITVTSPFTNRPGLEYEEVMGYFVNLLPIRDQVEAEMNFTDFLDEVKETIIEAYKNVQCPNNLIFRELNTTDAVENSLFDVTFVLDSYEEDDGLTEELEMTEISQEFLSIPSNLMMVFQDTQEGMIGKLQYNSGLFKEETMERMSNHFIYLLKQITTNPEADIFELELIKDKEESLILDQFNDTEMAIDYERTIYDLFEEQVAENPDQVGIVDKDNNLTYREINQKANQLARSLREKGVKPESTVGIMVDRCPEMIIGILGILKAGGAYVPLDPDYPDERTEYILEDSATSLLLTKKVEKEFDWDGELIDISFSNDNLYQGSTKKLLQINHPTDLAYIIYTSGSTGKPKGVMIEHRNVVNILSVLEDLYPLTNEDTYLLKTPFTFDVSVTELFGWFAGNGKLAILEPKQEKDPVKILEAIEKYQITHINFVPSLFRPFLDLFTGDYGVDRLSSLNYIFVAGEAVKPKMIDDFYSLETDIEFVNIYGPTEATIYASNYPLKNFSDGVNVPIGQPLPNCKTYIVDKNKLQPIGVPGELCLSGVGLARGYVNREELTAEKFVPNPFIDDQESDYKKMYRTGDLARWLPDGNMEYLGRIDFQVKIRGNRVELGEIANNLMEYEKIRETVVTAKETEDDNKVLCAYYTGAEDIIATELRKYLADRLPSYMIPAHFISLEEMPHTTSGKIDRKELPIPEEFSREVASDYIPPQTEIEQTIAEIWKEVLNVEQVGLNDNFFDLGGHSLSLIKVNNKLKQAFNKDIPVVKLFQHSTINSLVELIDDFEEENKSGQSIYREKTEKEIDTDIAVIGMSGRFPGAEEIEEFWDNLKKGVESIKNFSAEELKEAGVSEEELNNPNYVKAKGVIDDVEYFDPEVFNYSPREVEVMDPQLRTLYKCAQEALERGGYNPDNYPGLIGCFAGCSDNYEWANKFLLTERNMGDQYQAFTLNASNFLSTRISYKLDLKGPSYTAQTGCSTSLVTIHLACQSLINGECDMALAGGVTVELPREEGYIYDDGMMFSPDGHCRPFDEQAAGTVFSNGAGMVLLKPLDQAIEDGDHIEAVIKGSAINNDGNDKVAYTAPSVEGQAKVMKAAYRRAGLNPETIDYIEAHGTGTNMGDPIELESLQLAFNTDKKQFCHLGSVKGNVGHTDIAAGVTGFIKTALCLKNKKLPPTVNFDKPNPKLDLINSPFTINQELIDWESNDSPLRAGINSFGVGGTNAHMILEEAPDYGELAPGKEWNVLCLSAETKSALSRGIKNLADYLDSNQQLNLSDVAYTLQVGRKNYQYRQKVVCKTIEEAVSKLESAAKLDGYNPDEGTKNINFILAGSENQEISRAKELYEQEDYFKELVDDSLELLAADLREEVEQIYQAENFKDIEQRKVREVAAFILEYALAKLLIKWGIEPTAMVGKGPGEYAAACVGEVISLADILELIVCEEVEEIREKLEEIEINKPSISYISTRSGQWVNRDQLANPEYWLTPRQDSKDFKEGVEKLAGGENDYFLDLGTAGNLAKTICEAEEPVYFSLLPDNRETSNCKYLIDKIGRLWCEGIDINWDDFYEQKRYRVVLPTYSFDQHYFSVDVLSPEDLMGGETALEEVAASESTTLYEREKSEDYIAPRDEIEEVVVGAFEQVLGVTNISVDEDFFELGGDSLKAVSLNSELHKELNVELEISELFNHPTPEELAEFISDYADENLYSSIEPAEEREYYPLSSAQKRMYALYQLEEQSVAYNLPTATIIEGKIDFKRFEEAFQQLIDRHEALRTSFEVVDGKPMQKIDDNVDLNLNYKEVSITDDNEIDDLAQEFIKPYDLSEAPLFRIELVKIGEGRHVLLFDVHHIIADGTSAEIMVRDGCQLYFNDPEDLQNLRIQYKDFAVWQNDLLNSDKIKDQKEYWVNKFKGEIPILDMPTDYPRPPIKSFEGDRVYFEIGEELTEKVKEFASNQGATLYMTLLSIYNVLLHKYSGQEDIIVGSPTAGRRHADLEEIVGMFINNLPIRNFPASDKTFQQFLAEVKENTLEAFENQDYQFDALVNELDLDRDVSRNPLFETEFDLQNMEFYDWNIEELQFSPYQLTRKTSQFDIALECQEEGDKIAATFEYCTEIFKQETVERLAKHYRSLLETVTEQPELKLADIDVNTEEDKRLLLEEFNDTEREYGDDKLLSELFEEQVEKEPDRTAVIFEDKSLTNQELNNRTNQLARKLRNKGVGRETKVGLLTERSLEMVISILAVLKAGGTYIPLDPEYPAERINYMIEDSGANFLLTQEGIDLDLEFSGEAINVDDDSIYQGPVTNLEPINQADDLAYIIYTSGSTGNPKGVMIPHQAVHNFINGVADKIEFNDKKIISVTTFSFDIFVLELLLPLVKGETTVIANEEEQRDPVKLNQVICKHDIDMIQTTPSRMKTLVDDPACAEAFATLNCIMVGGENFPLPLLEKLQDKTDAKIYNMYGPTEATVWSSIDDLTEKDRIEIGQPIANTDIYIVNENNQLQPIGVYGELCIAGDGLARGYHNLPEKTEEVFVDNPFVEGERMYKTGDLARWLPNGELDIRGRIDHQVKIRGYRVELGEIEQTLLDYQSLKEVCVVKRTDENNNNYLTAYYVVKGNLDSPATSELRDFVSEKLPHYMIPSHFVEVEAMPLTPNGKIDRNALPKPDKFKSDREATFVEPKSNIEKQIADIWKEVLGIEEVGVTDNFFEIGGHSLAVIQVTQKMRQLVDREIPTVTMFQYPTIKSLVDLFKSEEVDFNITVRNREGDLEGDIAVVGLSGRFPGAKNITEYWDLIKNGKETITHFTDQELKESGIEASLINNPNYVKAKGYLEDIKYFDADFFDYSPKEAEMMDPQLRLLHQSTWKTLEHAGYNPDAYNGSIGLYLGSASNMAWMTRFLGQQGNIAQSYDLGTLNEKDFVATRIAYKLNLQGPSFTVQTACSTSLVAIHLACQSILEGECDMALAGGVAVSLPRKEGYLYQEGMIFSPDGRCRPFDAQANGTVFGEGIGVVALKRLEDALEDGDYIHGVIKGSAINNDGDRKVGFTAPSIEGQAETIKDAYNIAGVDPETVGYIEAHGTGTQLGDPVEIQALQTAFNTPKKQYCAIGSVKANIGHLDTAAGVAGFIKAVLSLRNRKLPPVINFNQPNSKVEFENSPFFINSKLTDWKADQHPLRAGVSSFGIGGTNCHIVLEEAPERRQQSNE